MLRELKTFTAECDTILSNPDCEEIITFQAPDDANALLVLEGKEWSIDLRNTPSKGVWYELSCPSCQQEQDYQDDSRPFSGPLETEHNKEARYDYSDD